MPPPRKYQSNKERQAAYRARTAQTRRAELADRGLPALPAIPSLPGQARWNAAIKRCYLLLDTVKDEMQDYFDARSEAWQESERATQHQECIDAIEELLQALDALML